MAAFTQFDCVDFSLFQETLKKMRLFDDTITYALNTQLPTESFKAQKDGRETCKELYDTLENNYKHRGEAFERCFEYSRSRISGLKSRKEAEENNPHVLKDLRNEQNKIRFLETEKTVDDVIRARTRKVFYDKCRHHYLPDSMTH